MFSVCWKFGVHLACPRVFFSFCALLGDFLRDFWSSDLSGIWNKFLWGNWCSNISKHTYGDSLANHSLKSPEFEVSPNHSFFVQRHYAALYWKHSEHVKSKSTRNGWIILIDREITVYIQDQGRPKGHAPSVWPLRDGPFVSWPFRGLPLSW